MSASGHECPMHLLNLGELIMLAAKSQGRFPEDLTSLTNLMSWRQDVVRLRGRPYLCPAVKAPADLRRPDSFGYTYINWSARKFAQITNVPGEYPLVYDNSFTNHSYTYIYVLKVDGSVIVDVGGEWLQKFSSSHPEYHIPFPAIIPQ